MEKASDNITSRERSPQVYSEVANLTKTKTTPMVDQSTRLVSIKRFDVFI